MQKSMKKHGLYWLVALGIIAVVVAGIIMGVRQGDDVETVALRAQVVPAGGVEVNIQLQKGWNTVSSCVQPNEPEMEDLFDDIERDVNMVKTEDGQQVYIPSYGLNTIGDWNYQEVYRISTRRKTTLSYMGTPMGSNCDIPSPLLDEGILTDPLIQNEWTIKTAASTITGVKGNQVLNFTGIAECPSNHTAMGGGYHLEEGIRTLDFVISRSQPMVPQGKSSPVAWVVSGYTADYQHISQNYGGGYTNKTIGNTYVTCAKLVED